MEAIEVLKILKNNIDKAATEGANYVIETIDVELIDRAVSLHNVSKRFEIDFDGNVLAGIEITNNEPKVFGAMNGWGNGISPDKCKITEKTD